MTWTRDPDVLQRSDLLAGSPIVTTSTPASARSASWTTPRRRRSSPRRSSGSRDGEIARASGYTAVLEQRDGIAFTLAVADKLLELTTRIALVPNTEWGNPVR